MEVGTLLTEATLNFKGYKTLRTENLECLALLKMWGKYFDMVAPGQSPIALFLWHPSFRVAAHCSDFRQWAEKGLTPFYSIVRRRNMYLENEMRQKIVVFSDFENQYREVYNLVRRTL